VLISFYFVLQLYQRKQGFTCNRKIRCICESFFGTTRILFCYLSNKIVAGISGENFEQTIACTTGS